MAESGLLACQLQLMQQVAAAAIEVKRCKIAESLPRGGERGLSWARGPPHAQGGGGEGWEGAAKDPAGALRVFPHMSRSLSLSLNSFIAFI